MNERRILLVESQERLVPRRQLFIKTLRDNGYAVKVIFWNRSGMRPSSNDKEGVAFEYVNVIAPYGDIRAAANILKLYFLFSTKICREKFDIIIAGHFFLLPLVVLLGRLKGAKVVYDAVEFYVHDTFRRLPFGLKKLEKPAYAIENLLIGFIHGVIVIPSSSECYYARFKKHNPNTALIRNVPVYSNPPSHADALRGNIIIYTGSISEDWGVLNLMKAISIVKKSVPDVRLIMFGMAVKGFDTVIMDFIERHGLTKQIEYRGFVPYTELELHYAKASVGVVPILNVDRFKHIGNGTSRKVFEYMNAGLPVVGPAFGECALVVKEEKCGVLVNTSSPEEIAQGILYCLQNPEEAKMMGQRGKEAVRKKYNWQMESGKLLSVLNRL